MKTSTRVISAVVVAGLCLVVGGTASASSTLPDSYVTLTYTGDDLARLGYVTYDGRSFLAQVGQSDFYVWQAPIASAGLGKQIVQDSAPTNRTTGYCIEVLKSIQLGGTYIFGVEDLSLAPTLVNSARATDLEKLFALYADKVTNKNLAAAFGAAVWEIVDETKVDSAGNPIYDVTGGDFKVRPVFGSSQSWDKTANNWLASLATCEEPASAFALVSARAQDFAWILPSTGTMSDPPPGQPSPVIPEPLTMISGLLASAAISFYARRRAKAQAAA